MTTPEPAPLRSVGGTRRPRKSAKSSGAVKAAAEVGSQRELLVALRARIAGDIDDPATRPADIASLSRRLLEIARDIRAIDAEEKRDDVSDAAATPDAAWPAT